MKKDEAWRKKGLPEGCADAVKTWDDCNAAGSFYWNYQLYRDRQATDVHNEPGQLGSVPLLEPRVDAEEHAVKQ